MASCGSAVRAPAYSASSDSEMSVCDLETPKSTTDGSFSSLASLSAGAEVASKAMHQIRALRVNGTEQRSKAPQGLDGAVIVFVCPGYEGKRFVYERAAALGVKAVVLDEPSSWARSMVDDNTIAAFVPINFDDTQENVFLACFDAIQRVASSMGRLDGVTTFCDMSLPLTATLAQALRMPGNTAHAVAAARDKHATRCIMGAAGLATPRCTRIECPQDLALAAQFVGFPAVLKPVAGSASFGVIRVDDSKQLAAAYARIMADLASAMVVGGSLFEGDAKAEAPSANGRVASGWLEADLVLEEFLDGPEVDVDIVLFGGEPLYAAVTDNWPTLEPWFNETGSNAPSMLPADQQAELVDLCVSAVQALGFKSGVFHAEAKYTSHGARLIEVNPRMGGGPVRDTNLLVWGVDLVEQQLMCTVGCRPQFVVPKAPKMHLAEYSINAHKSGVLRDTAFLEGWLQTHPDVVYARPLVQAGGAVVGVADGLPTWVCELMVKKPTVGEAVSFINEVAAGLAINID